MQALRTFAVEKATGKKAYTPWWTFSYLTTCPQCCGFWVGVFYSSLCFTSAITSFAGGVRSTLMVIAIGAAVSYLSWLSDVMIEYLAYRAANEQYLYNENTPKIDESTSVLKEVEVDEPIAELEFDELNEPLPD